MKFNFRNSALVIFTSAISYLPLEIFADGEDSASDVSGHSKPIHTQKKISKKKTVVTLVVQDPVPVSKQGFLHKLYGMPSSNSIRLGALVYHMASSCTNDCSYTYPFASLTIHNVYLSYFNNTFHRNTYGIGMERTWFKKSLSKNFDFNVNYVPVVFLGGYCIKGLNCRPRSLPVVPALQVGFIITYKKRMEIDFAWIASVVTLGVGYRFN